MTMPGAGRRSCRRRELAASTSQGDAIIADDLDQKAAGAEDEACRIVDDARSAWRAALECRWLMTWRICGRPLDIFASK